MKTKTYATRMQVISSREEEKMIFMFAYHWCKE